MKYVIRPNAKDDILRQFRYYLLEDALDAATRFLDAMMFNLMRCALFAFCMENGTSREFWNGRRAMKSLTENALVLANGSRAFPSRAATYISSV